MLHTLTLSALCEELQQGRVSSRELTQHFLDRIEQHDPVLNSFITVTTELALQQADQADQRRLKGDAHALTGIPLAHKDNFCTAGQVTSCGSRVLEHFVAVNESRFGFEQTTEHLGWLMKQERMALQAVVPPSVD